MMAREFLIDSNEQQAPRASADWRATLRSGHILVFGLLGGFILWASTARLDGAAVAAGVVEAESSRKTVQHLEGGIVKELLVRNGDYVTEDQVIIVLDPLRFEAQNDLYKNQLAILLAQEARLLAEYDLSPVLIMPKEVMERLPQPSVAPVVADQNRMFRSRRDEFQRNLQVAQSGIDQVRKDIEQTKVDALTAQATMSSVSQELDSLTPLLQKQLVTLTRIKPLEREKLRQQGLIEGAAIQQMKLVERAAELDLKKRQVQQDYQKDASTALIDVRRMLSDVRQQLVLANDSQRRSEIRAPISGTVQQMKIFTVGGVIRPGDPILEVAPSRDELVVQAQVQPDDVDRVSPGMEAELKFPAFNYWGETAILGQVRSISHDRITSSDGKTVYFASEIIVNKKTLPELIGTRLMAGMTANVIITTGKRTVLDYLIRPLSERFSKSLRER